LACTTAADLPADPEFIPPDQPIIAPTRPLGPDWDRPWSLPPFFQASSPSCVCWKRLLGMAPVFQTSPEHSGIKVKSLIRRGQVFDDFSECVLILLDYRADLDSAIPRFESWRPSQESTALLTF
jgi:hypothetical protein